MNRLKESERPPVHERRGMVYGIALSRDASSGWACDREGKTLLWTTRDAALEGNDGLGWPGYVRQYPGGAE